jgi:hypothetical protein
MIVLSNRDWHLIFHLPLVLGVFSASFVGGRFNPKGAQE